MNMEVGMQNARSKLTRKASDGRCPKTPVTGRSLIIVRPVTAVPPKIPEKGIKATQYRERTVQILTVIELCSTQGCAAPPSCTRRHPSNSGKGDLDSIRAFRQKNLVCTRKGLTFRTSAPRGVSAMWRSSSADPSPRATSLASPAALLGVLPLHVHMLSLGSSRLVALTAGGTSTVVGSGTPCSAKMPTSLSTDRPRSSKSKRVEAFR
mmetsp:Transcript_77118/g.153065  ORF Transcript_77118/g.153065 Transcript_77118/m.153065 type:complete len:208 (-) Transcript_77118:1009-1632(-)